MVNTDTSLLDKVKIKRRPSLELWSCWLQKSLPEFGIVQINVSNEEALLAQFERDLTIPLPRWSSTDQFASFNGCLDQLLQIPEVNPAYRQYFLRRWAESGNVLWLYINGDALNDAMLEEIAESLPLNSQGQYAVRILLKLEPRRLHSPALIGLRGRIFESIENPLLHSLSDSTSMRRISMGVVAMTILGAGFLLVRDPAMIAPVSQSVKQWVGSIIGTELPLDISTPELSTHNVVDPLSDPLVKRLSTTDLSSNEPPLAKSKPVDIKALAPVADDIVSINWEQSENALDISAILASSLSNELQARLVSRVTEWASAWQRQDPKTYLGFYDDQYSTEDQPSAEQWRAWREERITAPEWIRVELGPIGIKREGVTYETRFWQLYRASGYQDNVEKVLTWIKRDDRWLIVNERLVSAEKLTAN